MEAKRKAKIIGELAQHIVFHVLDVEPNEPEYIKLMLDLRRESADWRERSPKNGAAIGDVFKAVADAVQHFAT